MSRPSTKPDPKAYFPITWDASDESTGMSGDQPLEKNKKQIPVLLSKALSCFFDAAIKGKLM